MESSDMVVITKAQEIDAILLSLNGDFSHIVNYPPKNYKGICSSSKLIVFAFGNKGPSPIFIVLGHEQANSRKPTSLIWVQLGCTKTSRGFLRAPRVAIGAVKLQPVTSGRCTVTAEVASSSLVVPAIIPKKLRIGGAFPIGAKRCTSSLLAPHFYL